MSSSPTAPRYWLISPEIDLLFVMNVGWPLLVLIAWFGAQPAQEDWLFLQVYFLTTPHRWITLFLAWGDTQKRKTHWQKYLILMLVAVLVCGLTQIGTGALTCLVTIDFIWNTWHFASQHHGIYRIYATNSVVPGKFPELLVRIFLRGSIVYAALRASGWLHFGMHTVLPLLDTAAFLIFTGLIIYAITKLKASPTASFYLLSVLVLYTAWLASNIYQWRSLILPLATASAWFHASEYMVVCTWAVKKKQHSPSLTDLGWIYRLAPIWTSSMLVYVLVLGVGGWYLNRQIAELWLAMNLVAAFLHYAYDGIIWRRQQASQAPSAAPAIT